MKIRAYRLFFCMFLCTVFFSVLSMGQTRKLTGSEIRIISEMMGKYERLDLFSGVVLLAKNDKIVFNKAYGYADRENKIRNNLDTRFHLASVSKLFTIVAILKLHDEGKLDENDTIGKYFAGFSKDIAEKVSIRHLITMTSGLGDCLSNDGFIKNPGDFKFINDYLKIIKREKLAFEPGSRELYSNSGFVLLGGIIEKASGMNYFEYIEKNICFPAGMKQTYCTDPSSTMNEAVGYHRNFLGEYEKAPAMFPASPAGNAHSSAEDLMKFSLKACSTNGFLSDKAKVLFYSEFDPNYNGDWDSLKSNLKRVFGWTGGMDGASTLIRHYIGDELTIVILSNYSPDISIEVWENIRAIMTDGSYEDVQIPIKEKIYKAFKENGSEFVKNNFAKWTMTYMSEKKIIPPVSILNSLGYGLIEQQNLPEALAIFKLNTELFPNDANTYDSLAEAYMKAGDKELAIANYEKTLKLDPQNTNAAEKLKELKGIK